MAGPAGAGTTPWVEFVDETSSRLVADPFVGAQDPEEKDYAWGDVDNDGDIDLVVVRKVIGSNSGGKRNVLFLNEGGVLVDRTVEYATDADDGGQGFLDLTPDRDVALVDVNQDGWLDIVTAPTGFFSPGLPKTITHPRVYINNGGSAGAWQGFTYQERRIPTLSPTPNFAAVAAGDVTGDGHADLYFVDFTNTLEDRLLVNDGSGFFIDETSLRLSCDFVPSNLGASAAIADINGDGSNDILKVAHHGPLGAAIAYNDAKNEGTFRVFDEIYDFHAQFGAVDDLNNDGMLDIVVADEGTDRYLLNQGNGPDGLANFIDYTLPDPPSQGFDNNTVIADLDKDGFLDVLTADVDADLPSCLFRVNIYHNQGFAHPPGDPPPAPYIDFVEDVGNLPTQVGGPLRGTHDIAVFDIDGDTWPDLVIGTCTGTTVWINQPPCPADINTDGVVNVLDLIELLLCFGQPANPPCDIADVNGDGTVNVLDLIQLLLAFGQPCP